MSAVDDKKTRIVSALRELASALEDVPDAEPIDDALRMMARVAIDELARLDTHGETPKATAVRVSAIEEQLRRLRSDMQALRLEVVPADPIVQARAGKMLEKYDARPAGVKRVYFIQQGEDGPIKIGFTVDLRKRLVALRTSTPHPLRLLLEVPGGEDVERDWHKRFAHVRLNGEWFRPDDELLQAIAYVKGERETPPGEDDG